MDSQVATTSYDSMVADRVSSHPSPAICWGAILGGAVAAAALSLILLALGSGLGLSAVSPWSYRGASAGALGTATIIWLFAMSAAASGLGGYLSGRLRTRWVDADDDESFFRDTAHGLLAWAVATIVGAGLLASAASSMVGAVAAGATTVGTVAGGAAVATIAPERATGPNRPYFVDMLFRGAPVAPGGSENVPSNAEATAIMGMGLAHDKMLEADRDYLAQLVMRRTGLNQADAQSRVEQVTLAAKSAATAAEAKAKELADDARRAGAYLALWVFASLLVGAFTAAVAATWGGRQRDAGDYLNPVAGQPSPH
ncbi:MAG: hypothetical protein ABI777_05735 [Betaproteobacteria bacterium]